jgi:hypothetical protein
LLSSARISVSPQQSGCNASIFGRVLGQNFFCYLSSNV